MSCRESVSLGAYVLGALEPAERASVERHLAGCRSCRDEVVSFAPLPGLLRHTPFEELPEVYGPLGSSVVPVEPVLGDDPDFPDTPFEAFGPRQMALVPPEGAAKTGPAGRSGGTAPPRRDGDRGLDGRPRPSRRRRVLAVAAVFLTACASALFIYLGPDSQEEPGGGAGPDPVTTLSATDPDTRVWASAALTPKTWGTEVELELRSLPENVRCVMVVHDRAGRTETGGSWASGHYSTSTIPASTSVNEQDIARIDVVSDDGDLLVSLPRAHRDGAMG